ncbi:hypothetical protein ACU8NH_06240 [Rhizobium leguminosarum]
MRLLTFTRAFPEGVRISINPQHVIAVDAYNTTTTNIHVAVTNSNGHPFMYQVTENADYVVEQITTVLNS